MKAILRLRGGVCSLNKLINLNKRFLDKLLMTVGAGLIIGGISPIQKNIEKTTCNSRVTGKQGLRRFKDAFWRFCTTETCIKKCWKFVYRFTHYCRNDAARRFFRSVSVTSPSSVEMTRGKSLASYALYLATIKSLFCVCLAHARRWGLGTPAAIGVALKTVPFLQIKRRNQGKNRREVQKWWRGVSFFRRNTKKLGRKAIPLKRHALSFSLSNFLFCVCLAHARRRGLGTPAAIGVASKNVPLLQITKRNQGKNRREVKKWWRGVSFFRRDVKKLRRNAVTSKLSALSFSLAIILFCVCLAHARQRGQPYRLNGTVSSAVTGVALEGATVQIRSSGIKVLTDKGGAFSFLITDKSGILEVSYVGHVTKEVAFTTGQSALDIALEIEENKLDEAVVIAYGTTTRRLNTGSVTRITAEEINKQPVINPLAALQGRVPGMVVTQGSGVPGSGFNVQIRGQNSLAQGSAPLFIVDGVPFGENNTAINRLNTAAGTQGLSPFNSINPQDIESIEVLKDADATAIYGSRGANGVVLITTKQAAKGSTSVNFGYGEGRSIAARMPKWLNTDEYLQMRKEAFANDGVAQNLSNAYDLLVWDTLKYTNWQKLLTGNTAHDRNAFLAISGGSENTQFTIRGSLAKQGTVFPGDFRYQRSSLLTNIQHQSHDKRFTINLSANYNADENDSPGNDLTAYSRLPPNHPELLDDTGLPLWEYNGIPISDNPLAYLQREYESKTNNWIINTQLSYRLLEGLDLRTSAGFNRMTIEELRTNPSIAQNPLNNPTPAASFANNLMESFIVEPQLAYRYHSSLGNFNFLLGATYQRTNSTGRTINASNYASDAMLKTVMGASTINASDQYDEYKYAAVFGRITYNYADKYLINITSRRDGSSRFGPGRQYATFGAIGGAWLFSKESYVERWNGPLSFGKLRASYGITGNDAIGNYQYLGTLTTSSFPYGANAGIYPSRLFNPDYGWERNRKLEFALETGFFKDKLMFSAAYFRNKSDNQLIQYSLPSQTGFTSITRNFPAVVINRGWELTAEFSTVSSGKFNWNTAFNITLPRNELKEFADIETSPYRNRYKVGMPLNISNGYQVAGVNVNMGNYEFISSDGGIVTTPTYPGDLLLGLYTLDPKYFGGLNNTLSVGSWSLTVFFEFRKQMGYAYANSYTVTPGLMYNQPLQVMDRWRAAGDITDIQRFTVSPQSDAYRAYAAITSFGGSNRYTDASFIRLKNVSLAYNVPEKYLQRFPIKSCQLYLKGQNLLTITSYKYGDPENQTILNLPPLMHLLLGVQINL
jgi:TonB-dependent starch-binding outer membrane protein SusC